MPIRGGPVSVTNGVPTPRSRVITPVTHFFSANLQGPHNPTPFITDFPGEHLASMFRYLVWMFKLLGIQIQLFGIQIQLMGPAYDKIKPCPTLPTPSLHPGKLTCPVKMDQFRRKYIFQPLIFRRHVSFQGCIYTL